MSMVSLFREQFREFHRFLEGAVEDVTPEQAHWIPPGKANPLGANYVHLVMDEDLAINGLLRNAEPLTASNWAGRVGISELPPVGPNQVWDQWARRVRIDLAAFRPYALAVYETTDEYLASITDDALQRSLDLSAFGVGQQTVRWVLNNAVWHLGAHCGEISCLKGLQGVRGYLA